MGFCVNTSVPFLPSYLGGPFSAAAPPSANGTLQGVSFFNLGSAGLEYPFAGFKGPPSAVPLGFFGDDPATPAEGILQIPPVGTMPIRSAALFFGVATPPDKSPAPAFPDNPQVAKYRGIILNGVCSARDYQLAIKFFKELPALTDDENRAFAEDLAAIVTEFEKVQDISAINSKDEIPGKLSAFKQDEERPSVKVFVHGHKKKDIAGPDKGDDPIPSTSFCMRTARQTQGRYKMFASAIYLEQGALLSWMIHEIVHAMPIEKLPPRFREISNPIGSISGEDSVSEIYSALIGHYIRDEARAGLGEIFLKKAIEGAGVKGIYPRKLKNVADGGRIYAAGGCVSYMDEGTYLGDNHFVLYQLNGLYQLAKAMHANPKRLKDFFSSDNTEQSGLWDKKTPVAIGEVNFLELYQRFHRWLADDTPRPGEPLNPIRKRIRDYLGRAAPVRRAGQTVMEIEVELTLGDRPLPSPAGNPERITRDPELTRDRVTLVGTYASFLDELHRFSFAEVRANLRSYLRFAERCHPGLAGIIYGRLFFAMKDALIPPLESIELAHSLLKSGYAREGTALLDEAVGKLGPIMGMDAEWNEILLDLHRAGRDDVVSKVLGKVEDGRAELHRTYRDEIMRAFNRHVWWKRGGQAMLKGVLGNHAYGVPDALLYETVFSLGYHKGNRRAYFKYEGFRNYEGGDHERTHGHPRRIYIDGWIETRGDDAGYRYYQARQAMLLHDLYEVQREYLEKLRRGPMAIFYLTEGIGQDPMADETATIPGMNNHLDRWRGHIAEAERTGFRWYRKLSRRAFGRNTDVDSAIRAMYASPNRQNMRASEVRTRFGIFSTAYIDDIEGDLFYDEALYIETMLKTPGKFKEALRAIKALPEIQTKAYLFGRAASCVPEDFKGKDVGDFVRVWHETIEHVAGNLPEWNYVESGQMRSRFERAPSLPLPSNPRRSHFYLAQMTALAEFFLERPETHLKEAGAQIINSLEYDTQFTYSVHATAEVEALRLYQPDPKINLGVSSAVLVSRAMIKLSAFYEEAGDNVRARESALRAADILLKHKIEGVPDTGQLTSEFVSTCIDAMGGLARFESDGLITDLYAKAGEALRTANRQLAVWEEDAPPWRDSKTALFEFLREDAQLYNLAHVHWHFMTDVNYRDERKDHQDPKSVQVEKVRRAERDLLSIGKVHLAMAGAGGRGDGSEARAQVDRLLGEFESDLEGRDRFFPVTALILTAETLAGFPGLGEEAKRAYSIAIRALSLSRGTDEEFERNVWSISKSIDESGLDAVLPGSQDGLFTELVDRLFPESKADVWVSESAFSILAGGGNMPGILDYVMRQERYPKAESALIHKAAEVRRLIAFDRADTPPTRAKKLFILREFFLRVSAHGEIFSQRSAIREVVKDAPPDVIAAFNAMFPEKTADVGEAVAGYPAFEAIRQGAFDMDEVVEKLSADFASVSEGKADPGREREVARVASALFVTELSTGKTQAHIEELRQGRIFAVIYPYLKGCLEDGRRTEGLGRELMSALLSDGDRQTAGIKAPLYLAILREGGVIFDVKKKAFDGLHLAGEVSDYVHEAMGRRLASASDNKAGLLWLGRWLKWNETTSRRDDFSQSLYLEANERALESIFHAVDKWYATVILKEGPQKRGFSYDKLNPLDMAQLELYMFDFGRYVSDEDRARASAGLAVGGESHIHTFGNAWKDMTGLLGYCLAFEAASSEGDAEKKFRRIVGKGAPDHVRYLLEAFRSMRHLRPNELPGFGWTLDEDRIRSASVVDRDKISSMDHVLNIVAGINKAIDEAMEEMASHISPDIDNELAELNRHLDQLDEDGEMTAEDGDEETSAAGFKRIDDIASIGGWTDDDFERHIDELRRLEGHDDLIEFLEEYQEVKREIQRVFEEVNPQNWHRFAAEEAGREFGVTAANLGHPDAIGRIDSLKEILRASDNPQRTYKGYLERVRRWNMERLSRLDRAEMTGVELPEVIRDRPPLARFLGTRYFLELSVGERRVLMEELKDVPEGEALLKFFKAAGLHKVGQFLSVRAEVPADIQAELKALQDSVAPGNWEDVRQTIFEAFGELRGREIADHIVVLDPATGRRCLKAGTIGEVYIVQWDDGKREVLKIIPRSKRAKIELALGRMERVRERLRPNAASIDGGETAVLLLDKIIASMREELDLQTEVKNAGKFGAVLAKLPQDLKRRIVIPVFNPEYVNASAVLMSFEEGERIDELSDPALARESFEILEKLLFETIANHDMAPEDLHPGNFLVRRNGDGGAKVVILDFGRMINLTEDERAKINSFVAQIVSGATPEKVAQGIERMSEVGPAYRRRKLEAAIAEKMRGVSIKSASDAFSIISALLTLAGGLRLSIHEVYLKVLKAVSTFQGAKNIVADMRKG